MCRWTSNPGLFEPFNRTYATTRSTIHAHVPVMQKKKYRQLLHSSNSPQSVARAELWLTLTSWQNLAALRESLSFQWSLGIQNTTCPEHIPRCCSYTLPGLRVKRSYARSQLLSEDLCKAPKQKMGTNKTRLYLGVAFPAWVSLSSLSVLEYAVACRARIPIKIRKDVT